MFFLLSFVIQTANILGILLDPFEFEGDYGTEANATRSKVFEQVVSKEMQAKNLSEKEVSLLNNDNANPANSNNYKEFLINEGTKADANHGPTLEELVTFDLLKKIEIQLESLGIKDSSYENILFFLEKYKHEKIFYLFRNIPDSFLSLDKSLKDQAVRNGKEFSLPILGSITPLSESHIDELKSNLAEALFKKEILSLAKSQNQIRLEINNLPSDYVNRFLDRGQNLYLELLSSPLGQVFFYWMYQSLNLQLCVENKEQIQEVNHVKKQFASYFGDAKLRARLFLDKLIEANVEVLFTQESDATFNQVLTELGGFLPVESQNIKDGTLVFLRSDCWEPNYQVMTIPNYEGFEKGRLNVILAKRKESGQRFLLAAGHGNSTNSEDGRNQIELIMEQYHHLFDRDVQLVIGSDANTKTEEDVEKFKKHLNDFGLMHTNVGPTTVKHRMVTTQHAKAGKLAVDEEDYLIVLKPENGGKFQLNQMTVGFEKGPADVSKSLPNLSNPSDHYSVGATLTSLD